MRAFIAAERVPAGGLPDGYFPGPPDLAVEVVAPSDTAREVQDKVDDYFTAGTQQVWILYPGQRKGVVHLSAREARSFAGGDTRDGGELPPGFTCPVARLFE